MSRINALGDKVARCMLVANCKRLVVRCGVSISFPSRLARREMTNYAGLQRERLAFRFSPTVILDSWTLALNGNGTI